MIESIVVGRVGLGEIGWRDDGHFVSIDGVLDEKVLDLVGDLLGRETIVPGLKQAAKHRVRSARLLFAQFAVHRQLVVGHAHVDLVQLGDLAVRGQRFEFGCGRRFVDLLERCDSKLVTTIQNKRSLNHSKLEFNYQIFLFVCVCVEKN